MNITPTPFVVRPVAPSSPEDDGAAVRARAVVILEDERNPSLEQMRAERDPRLLDAEFYTGIGERLARSIEWELNRFVLRRK